MDTHQAKVKQQYAKGEILNKIKEALSKVDKNFDTITPEDVTGVDEFHIRGRESTAELVELMDISPNSKILDVGCGLGGACRYLASEYSANAIGIDITEDYCRAGDKLTKVTGLHDKVTLQQADACALPFEDKQFDSVITLHTQMNIKDKESFYKEIWRVLKPGGQLGFYDIFGGRNGSLQYPVPWADEPSISWLAEPDYIRNLLDSMNFKQLTWHDDTEIAFNWFKQTLQKVKESGPPPLGIHLLMGEDAPNKMKNVVGNLENDRLSIIRAVYQK